MENAEEIVSKHMEALSALRMAQSRIEAELERIDSELKNRFPRADDINEAIASESNRLEIAIKSKAEDLQKCEAAAAQLQSTTVDLEKLNTQLQTLNSESKALHLQLLEKRSTVERSSTLVKELEAQVPEKSRNVEEILKRGSALSEEIDRFEKRKTEARFNLDQALQEASTSRATLASLENQKSERENEAQALSERLQRALFESGFSNIESCRAAGLDIESTQALQERYLSFERDLSNVSLRLQELNHEIEQLPDWSFDLEARKAELEQLEIEKERLLIELTSVKNHFANLNQVREKLSIYDQRLVDFEERYRSIGKLSEVAAGRPPNNSKVNFQRFVLAQQLDEVLAHASRRLFEMSRGQFILKRALHADDKRKNAGLDLVVEDSHTGTSRPTASLSGGEGFLASLSLALGLSDVVQSHLGGVRLDAIFIDEGFGTLDSETLELAMKTLAELRVGGRIVGIISHVPELRDQIAHRLLITKSPEGSEISWEQ
jgi:exonuclease SbcC